jgi:DNA mismatch endonuclease, patch repair protein
VSAWPGDASSQKTSFGRLSRSDLMRRIRSRRNGTTEERLASLLRRSGITGWRRNIDVLGRPDFVWSKNRLVLFVDGCFWHGHNCGRNLQPKTNAREWMMKFERNKQRDKRVSATWRKKGWRVLRIWECDLSLHPDRCIGRLRAALKG